MENIGGLIILLICFAVSISIIVIIIDERRNTKELTNLFILRYRKGEYVIRQRANFLGRRELNALIDSNKEKPIREKIENFSSFFRKEVGDMLTQLTSGQEYVTTTHFLNEMLYLEKQSIIKITEMPKFFKKRLLREMLIYLSLLEIIQTKICKKNKPRKRCCKNCCENEKCRKSKGGKCSKLITKKFYTIKFIKL